jgi:uncharacterized protein GlcG (DUF336 family)
MAESVTLTSADEVIAAARAKADEIGTPMNIAVVDGGGNLTAFARMDGAWLGSIDIAIGKAYSARAFDMPTDALGAESQPGEQIFGINTTNDGAVVIFGGGIPLADGERIVGGVGVSGGLVAQDVEVAQAGADAF